MVVTRGRLGLIRPPTDGGRPPDTPMASHRSEGTAYVRPGPTTM